MEQYFRNIVYRRYVGAGARDDDFPRPHMSFATLREAAEYVGFMNTDDRGVYEYTVIDLEHAHMGDMLKRDEARHITEPALEAGRQHRKEAA